MQHISFLSLILMNVHLSQWPVKKSDNGVNLLASLCHVYNTSEDDLRRTYENANKLIEDILKKKPQFASACKVENLDSINTGLKIYCFYYL